MTTIEITTTNEKPFIIPTLDEWIEHYKKAAAEKLAQIVSTNKRDLQIHHAVSAYLNPFSLKGFFDNQGKKALNLKLYEINNAGTDHMTNCFALLHDDPFSLLKEMGIIVPEGVPSIPETIPLPRLVLIYTPHPLTAKH